MLKSWLVSMYLSSLRKTVPEEQHANYLLTSQNIDVLKEVGLQPALRPWLMMQLFVADSQWACSTST